MPVSKLFAFALGATGMTFLFGMFPIWMVVVFWLIFIGALIGKVFGFEKD